MQMLSDTIYNQIKEQFTVSIEHEIFLEQNSLIDFFTPLDSYALVLLLNGSVTIRIHDNDTKLSKENGLFLPMETAYQIIALEESHITRIIFSGSIAKTIFLETMQIGNYIDSSTFFLLNRDLKYLQTLDSFNNEYISVSFSMLLHLYKKAKPLSEPLYPPLVLAAIHLMEENFTYLYGIEELAEQLEISKNHFIRQFHDAVGISPGRYLTNIKINHAKELLQNGETSLELIAITCGFSGASYFRKVFKKETGFSPSEFRKNRNYIEKSLLPDEFYL